MPQAPNKQFVSMSIKADRLWVEPQRVINKAQRKALKVAGKYWHRKYLPLHFKRAAYHRYPKAYKKRKPISWRDPQSAKRASAAARPLYDTGRAMTRAMTSPLLSAWGGFRSTRTRATVRFEIPGHVLLIRQWGYEPVKELTAWNPQEGRKLADIVAQQMGTELNRPHGMVQLPSKRFAVAA